MEVYELSHWADDYKENAQKIHGIACQIRTYTKRVSHGITKDQGEPLMKNIAVVLNNWTGATYVGDRKKKQLEKAFQAFFTALYDFIIECRNNDCYFNIESSSKILYRGMVYRYLGHQLGDVPDNSIVEPIYNDIYVSWSKNQHDINIEKKLRYPMTWMAAEIKEPDYGIDLVGLSKAISELADVKHRMAITDEREVVFPTKSECITEIKYIDYTDEEDDNE